jgi:hypothetical protein
LFLLCAGEPLGPGRVAQHEGNLPLELSGG